MADGNVLVVTESDGSRWVQESEYLESVTENGRLMRSYRCYSCKQVFEEDNGHGLAAEHFGRWSKGDRPKCEEILNGSATWGGGPHDPFYRVRKEHYNKLLADSEELKRTRANR